MNSVRIAKPLDRRALERSSPPNYVRPDMEFTGGCRERSAFCAGLNTWGLLCPGERGLAKVAQLNIPSGNSAEAWFADGAGCDERRGNAV